jgi:hypothetical protein
MPKYKGGSNKKENLVEVSITQHAMYHYCNYKLWSNEEDRIAWLALSGAIGKKEIICKAVELGRQKALTSEVRKKRKETFEEIKHQQGEKNSQYGTMWITDGTKEGTYRIKKGEKIPDGFRKGRISRDENSINYYYVITTPKGEIIKTKYLYDFCNLYGLSDSNMYRVAKGKVEQYKGYKVHREKIN